ncbi:hypothetical protein [Leptothrix discophora]|uniref:Uncharacterized protein n=1 Tax=Leptothrix discophora TaxID=89 RepID=A0ABT9G449_LEPDI|nr:hypothetical protein [Leptothrix discophora]MDP4301181.1 hypothetical protein [Leptothrix discophora]
MWKLVVGFILFAALALFVLSKGGDIDMSGEKHGVDAHEPAASAAAAPAASDAAAPAASAASGS